MNSATHIGMLLTWIIETDQYSKEIKDNFSAELAAMKSKTLTGAAFLMQCLDGKLSDHDLCDSGNEFVGAYHRGTSAFSKQFSSYLDDYLNTLDPDYKYETICHIEDSWENYAILKPVISQRFEEWKQFAKEV